LSMLDWLWHTVAHPILEYLGFGPQAASSNSSSLPRIIWIPTGPLSHFPIHAAGKYGGSSTLMDHAISSYSFSLKAFVFGHMWENKNTFRVPDDNMLLVGMGRTPGLRNLPFVTQEINKLASMAPDLHRELVCLAEPRRAVVLDELSKCDIFHFAGHGMSDPLRPLSSGLVLHDGHLTISDLLDYRISGHGKDPPFLAFLSACLTGTNDFEHLVDEGIHLISAFQLVGFEHVIGTLWQVDDQTCMRVAEGVYSEIARRSTREFFDEDEDGAVCQGLHNAVVAMRDEWI
ncbi:CHAT domain-containing protein, partial [Mariannaea sp. PMI_226]